MSGPKTYYDLLKIKASASAQEIEEAYRRRIARLHAKIAEGNLPPREEFDALERAYAALRDPELRAAYDERISPKPAAAPVSRAAPAPSNPYAPPEAEVADHEPLFEGEERLIPGGRKQPAGSGWVWITQGWALFKAQPLNWWLSILVGFGLLMAISIIPFVGMLNSLIMYPLIAGYGVCARNVLYEGTFEINQMFDGFRHRLGAQVCLGLLYLGILIGLIALIGIVMGGTGMMSALLASKGSVPPAAVFKTMGLILIVYIFLSMLVASLFIYAPYMIQEYDVGVFEAMGHSMRGCLRNIPAFLVFALITCVAMVIATLPFGLGWLIMLPVMYLSIYSSYRDIFVETGED